MTTTYYPFDQDEKLGPPPWSLVDEKVANWERAHGHDVRTKCYAEYGCLVIEHDAYERGYSEGRNSTLVRTCGGCEGEGAHWRWCPAIVGPSASITGQWAQQAENLADGVGANSFEAANLLYAAASRLRALAEQQALIFQQQAG